MHAQTAYAYCANSFDGLIGIGPVTFDLSTPTTVTLIQNQSSMNQVNAGTWANGIWYGIENNWTTPDLITIDPATGNRTVIGNLGITDVSINGMAFNVASGTLYILEGQGNLYSIDPLTGVATLIGGGGAIHYFVGLACSRDGVLYTTDENNKSLYTVDNMTGNQTLIAQVTGGPEWMWNPAELEYDLDNDILYWSTVDDMTIMTGKLFTIDPQTAIATLVGNYPGETNLACLVIPYTPPVIFPPQLTVPENNAYCIPILPSFEWTIPDGAVTYTIEISDLPDFSDIIFTTDGIATNQFTLPSSNSLNPVSTYYWRVCGTNDLGVTGWWSSKHKFTTEGSLVSPVMQLPINGAGDVTVPTVFTWDYVSGAQTYNIQVSATSDFSDLIINETGLTALKFVTGSLSLTTQYYWRVQAVNTCPVISDWSEVWNFTTTNIAPVYAYSNGSPSGSYPMGPIAFNITNPLNVILMQDQTGQTNINAALWYNGLWYALDFSFSSPSNLITINTSTGERSIIGSTGIFELTGLAFNYSTNILYSIDMQGQLYSIDPGTGVATLIGGGGGMYLDCTQLVCSPDGILYTFGRNYQEIYSINPATGVATQLYPIMSDSDHTFTMWSWPPATIWTYDYDSGTLYWAFFNTNYNQGELWTINIETGLATYLNPFQDAIQVSGLAIPYVTPLPPVQLLTPENNEYCIPLTPTLTWTPVDAAETYSFQLSDVRDFSTILIDAPGLTTTTYTISGSETLSPLTEYWWRVKVFNTSGESSWWSGKYTFFTVGPIPEPTLLLPENASSDVKIPTVFNWEPIIGASDYQLQVSTISDFSTLVIDQTITDKHSFKTMLDTITNYYWRLKGFNVCSSGAWSETWTFTTKSKLPWFAYVSEDQSGMVGGVGPVYFDLDNPSVLTLIADQTGQNPFTAGTWVNGVWYNIEQNTNNLITCNPGSGERTTIGSTGIMDCTGLTYDLTTNTMYGLDMGGQLYTIDLETGIGTLIGGSTTNLFVTLASSKGGFLFAADANNQTLYSIDKLTGTATLIAPLKSDSDQQLESIPNIQDWDFDLENDVLYWVAFDGWFYSSDLWKVNTQNGLCTYLGEFEGWSTFVSGLAIPYSPSPVPYPLLVSPAYNEYCISTTPTFDWDPSLGATNYTLQVSTTTEFTDLIIDQSGIPTDQFTVPPLLALNTLTQYWWRVQAFNAGGQASWMSTMSKFFTNGELPPVSLIDPVDGQDNVYTTPVLKWDFVIGATSYDLQVSTTSDFSGLIVDETGLTANTYVPSGLSTVSQYYWRVRAENPCGAGTWSGAWVFTTGTFVVMGTGTEFNDEYSWPAPYGNWYTQARHQMLFRADELLAAGMVAGDITSIGWDVLSLNDMDDMANFSIKMKLTTATEITGWDYLDLIEVWSAPSYMPIVGWNSHAFPTPFTWDGTSNLLVDVCFNDGTDNYTYSASTYYTDIAWNGCIYSWYDTDAEMCNPDGAELMTTEIVTLRPNTVFGGALGSPIAAPNLVSPLNGATGTEFNLNLNWTTVDGAIQYQVQVSKNSNFSNLLINDYVTTISTSLSNLENFTKYYWRVKAWTDVISSPWSTVWDFTTKNYTVPWTVITDTGNNSDIVVPITINPMIGDRPFQDGDAIGLFYQSSPGVWACAGFDVWTGSNLDIVVWGDNPATTVKDGYGVADPYFVRVWDGVDQVEYTATVTYSLGPDNYQINAISSMGSLIVNLPLVQNFNLPQGWSMISSYVTPVDPTLTTILSTVNNNIIILKNGQGQNYIPSQGVNQIVNWNPLNGYQIKLNTQTIFPINGYQIVPQSTPIPLNATWNLISYLRMTPMPVATALTGIGNTIVIVKNGLGQMYLPAYGINQIGNMNPGEGYYLNVNAAGSLIYPSNGALKAIAGELSPLPKYMQPKFVRTGNNASLILEINSQNGNEIGIYNTNGDLVGSGVVQNNKAAATIWGDDDYTVATEGAIDGEPLTVKLFNVQTGNLSDITVKDIKNLIDGNNADLLTYQRDALYHGVASTEVAPVNPLNFSVYPNPADGKVFISYYLPDQSVVKFTIVNDLGMEFDLTATDEVQTMGNHSFDYDLSRFTQGVYYLTLKAGNLRETTKLVIIR
jgi:hypothetical protein